MPFLQFMSSSDEDDSARNLTLRPSSMGGYLLKLKHRGVEEVSASPSLSLQTGLLADHSALNPFGQWNRRWINIEGHYVRWYTKVSSAQPSGSLDLRYVTCIRELHEGDKSAAAAGGGLVPGCFLVEGQERSLVLRCESPQEREKWIRILLVLVDKARGGDGTRGVSRTLQARPAEIEVSTTVQSKAKSAAVVPIDAAGGAAPDPTPAEREQAVRRPDSASSGASSRSAGSRSRASRKHKMRAAGDGSGLQAAVDLAGAAPLSPPPKKQEGNVAAGESGVLRSAIISSGDEVVELQSESPVVTASPKGSLAFRMNSDQSQAAAAAEGGDATPSSAAAAAAPTGVFHIGSKSGKPGSQLREPISDVYSSDFATLSGSRAASVDSEESGQSSMGSRLRRNIQDNPLEDENNNGRSGVPRRPNSGGGLSGMLGLGGRRGIGYGTGSSASASSAQTSAEATPGSVQVDAPVVPRSDELKVGNKLKALVPMPGTSAPAAYRIKKDDILKKLGGGVVGGAAAESADVDVQTIDNRISDTLMHDEELHRQNERMQQKQRAVQKAWGSPDPAPAPAPARSSSERARDGYSPTNDGIIGGGSRSFARNYQGIVDTTLSTVGFGIVNTGDSQVKSFSSLGGEETDETAAWEETGGECTCSSLESAATTSASSAASLPPNSRLRKR